MEPILICDFFMLRILHTTPTVLQCLYTIKTVAEILLVARKQHRMVWHLIEISSASHQSVPTLVDYVPGTIGPIMDQPEQKIFPCFRVHVDVIFEIVNIVNVDECACAWDLRN